MGELFLHADISAMAAAGRTTEDDILLLRQTVFKDGVVSRKEAEMVFALDRALKNKTASWISFYIESIADYLVMHEAPKGYVSQENATWLIRAISIDECIDSKTELELLLAVMDRATSMPDELSAFALYQVERAIFKGKGPLASDRHASRAIVTAHDVEMIRRILYAYGGDRALGVSRAEAEVLFNINDKSIEGANDPAWVELFTKAIAFSLMGATGHTPETMEKARERQQWLDDISIELGEFLSGAFSGNLGDYGRKLMQKNGVETAYAKRNAALEHVTHEAEHINAEEADWLANRIGRDGVLHENERRLLEFLKIQAPSFSLRAELQELLDQAA